MTNRIVLATGVATRNIRLPRCRMSTVPPKPLPLLRLTIYLLLVGGCGAVACRELYYALAGESTNATVVAMGKTGRPGSRTGGFWAQYEYFDTQGEPHLGRAES